MLNFSEVVLRRGARVLLERLNFTAYAGQRIGIVGRNGTGKSSLLAMIQGEITPDAGQLQLSRHLVIAHVRQETPALSCSALDYVLDGDAEWRRLNAQLEQAEAGQQIERLSAVHERMHAIDGYTAPARAARLLYGLGFASGDATRPVDAFSGGWRMRLNLAQALMCRSDLLLLDEPTNHLDLDAVLWLQSWLVNYPGTLLVISHDRDFLDAVATHILYFERAQANLYSGNYSASERQRAERLAQQTAEFQAQQRQAEHLQAFIDRFRAKASKARQAQSRIKQLEKMQRVAPAHWDSPFTFSFARPTRLPAPLLTLEKVSVGYGETEILQQVRCSLRPGDRIALLGRNGAGKSTLMRTLAGVSPVLAGEQLRDRHLSVGYFAQHQLDSLQLDASPMAHLLALAPDAPEQALRDFLGTFDFRDERVFEVIAPFSGGEKARLALALLVFQRPNLLLLDEPTNHLDLEMRYALEVALQEFAGAVVMVSHDRHLVASCADELWLVEGGRCSPYSGDLDDYAARQRERAPRAEGEPPPSDTPATARASAKEQRRDAAAQRAQSKPLRDELKRCERSMNELEGRLQALETALGDPELYQRDPQRAATLAREQGEARKQLDAVESAWMQAAEQLEQAQR